MEITKFKNIHKGKTVLIVGNGENLSQTPPEDFDYPSIGMNTIHLYEGWKPDYYVTVDRRMMNEFGEAVYKKFETVPKFTPKPKLLRWRGKEFYRFSGRVGPLYHHGENLWQEDIEHAQVTYRNVMHVAIKLAYFMGAKTILIIGMEHKPHNARGHFWGADEGMPEDAALKDIFEGYQQLVAGLKKHRVKLLNISENTYVPEEVIPKDKAKNWLPKKAEELEEVKEHQNE